MTSVLPRVTKIIRSQKLLRALCVEDSLCLLKAYEKREKGEDASSPYRNSPQRLAAPSVVWVSYGAALIFIKATALIASQRSLHFKPHHLHVDVPVFV